VTAVKAPDGGILPLGLEEDPRQTPPPKIGEHSFESRAAQTPTSISEKDLIK
jgi:hypothetical protein